MFTTLNGKSRPARVLRSGLAIAAALVLASAEANARAGKGGSSGSRGTHSQSAPPATQTAPRQAQPLPGQPGMASSAARQPSAAQPSRWGSGLMGGLMGGLLGAGLIGMLFGSGFMSGIGSMMGFLGLLLQGALIAGIVMLGLAWWRNRRAQPAAAMAGAEPMARQPMQPDWRPQPGAMGAMPMGAPAPADRPLQVNGDDFNTFQQRLSEVQEAYGRGDRVALAKLATPEMANRFASELDHDARQGAVNRISNITLLQGDLSEAWSEADAEYATVAMRYSLIDVTLDKASGKVLDGDPAKTQEATELWTFVRAPGAKADAWILSAIQQA